MDSTALFWFIVFTVAALLFFGTAVVITIVGVKDLKDLLSHSVKKD